MTAAAGVGRVLEHYKGDRLYIYSLYRFTVQNCGGLGVWSRGVVLLLLNFSFDGPSRSDTRRCPSFGLTGGYEAMLTEQMDDG